MCTFFLFYLSNSNLSLMSVPKRQGICLTWLTSCSSVSSNFRITESVTVERSFTSLIKLEKTHCWSCRIISEIYWCAVSMITLVHSPRRLPCSWLTCSLRHTNVVFKTTLLWTFFTVSRFLLFRLLNVTFLEEAGVEKSRLSSRYSLQLYPSLIVHIINAIWTRFWYGAFWW